MPVRIEQCFETNVAGGIQVGLNFRRPLAIRRKFFKIGTDKDFSATSRDARKAIRSLCR